MEITVINILEGPIVEESKKLLQRSTKNDCYDWISPQRWYDHPNNCSQQKGHQIKERTTNINDDRISDDRNSFELRQTYI